jgi:hypothetical protein
VHVGLIDTLTGGTVMLEMRGGETSYVGTTRNGITSLDYPSWTSSYVFVTP